MTTVLSVSVAVATSSPAAANCTPDGCDDDNGIPLTGYTDPVPTGCG